MEKADIEKLNSQLKKGDKKEISRLAGLSAVTLNKFFKGKEDRIAEQNVTKILEAAAIVIKNREKLKKKNEAINQAILNSTLKV